jgi:tetratricopeptide (TPR) repeat protein
LYNRYIETQTGVDMKRLFLMLALFSATAFAEPTFQQIEGLIEQKQYQAAESGLEQIIQNHPNSAKAFYAMSQAQAGLGHLDKAQFALNKARGLDPELKFASASNIESLQQAITPQTAKIEVVTESHVLRNFALFLLVVAGGYFVFTVYMRKQEEEAVKRGEEDAAALKRAEEWAERQEARRQAEEAQAAKEIAEYNAKKAAEAALKAHKNYGHERFDPANPDKLKSVKQFKEEQLAEAMVAQARAEAAEAKARADRAEMDARLARSNAASGPAHTTVVNNSSNDMLTTMVALDMLSHHNHDTTRVVEREVIREVPVTTRDTSWDTPAPAPSRSSTWDDTPSTPSRSSSWDDSSSSSSSSSWSSSSSDSSSSWSSSDSSSSSSSDW